MMWWDLDYSMMHDAKKYYVDKGFKYLEVPWVVSSGAYNATAPKKGHVAKGMIPVASGEQSFMQLVLDGLLSPGKYCCITPCFRPWDNGLSREHVPQFIKLELIQYEIKDHKDNVAYYNTSYEALKDAAFDLMVKSVPKIKIVKTKDDPRLECITHVSHDIETKSGLELGSYGIRSHPAIGYWIYGTGIALPRLTSAISQYNK